VVTRAITALQVGVSANRSEQERLGAAGCLFTSYCILATASRPSCHANPDPTLVLKFGQRPGGGLQS